MREPLTVEKERSLKVGDLLYFIGSSWISPLKGYPVPVDFVSATLYAFRDKRGQTYNHTFGVFDYMNEHEMLFERVSTGMDFKEIQISIYYKEHYV